MIFRRFALSNKREIFPPKYNDDYQIRQNETDVTSAVISKDYKCKKILVWKPKTKTRPLQNICFSSEIILNWALELYDEMT